MTNRLCGALFLEGLVQKHRDEGVIRKLLLVREILGRLDVGHREPHGNGLQGNGPPRLAGPQRSFHDLRAASGWLSHHLASAASVRNFGIAIGFLGQTGYSYPIPKAGIGSSPRFAAARAPEGILSGRVISA